MSDDGRLPSSTDFEATAARPDISTNKRKFEDAQVDKETSYTGMCARTESGGANRAHKAGLYSSVPPPLSDFEVAKHKAAQIAARLVGSASPGGEVLKRSRTEDSGADDRGPTNGSGHDHNFGEVERESKFHDAAVSSQSSHKQVTDFQQTPYHNPQVGFSESRKMDVPNAKVGTIIGKGGETIKSLQYQSGARIQITRDADADPNSSSRQVEIMGTPEQISRAEQLIKDVIAESGTGGYIPFASQGFGGPTTGEQASIRVPNSKVGLIIGRGGETIRSLQSRSGARIQFALPRDAEQGTLERVVTLTGTKQQTDMASELIKEVIDENRVRAPLMQGGYNPPSFRPPGRPPRWGPPGPPAHHPGYGYQHSPLHQYAPPPPPQQYGGYSQLSPAGYNPGWNQRTSGPPQQPQQGSYTSYPQRSEMQQTSQPGAGTTEGNYGYNQQGYYGGYQQQPPAAHQQSGFQPQLGYSQSQLHQSYYNQPQESCSQSQQSYGHQQESYNQQEGYAQQGYDGGYEDNQASQDQQAYGQQPFLQQSYHDQSQYAQSSEGSLQQSAAGGYNQTPSSYSAAP